MLHVVAPSIRTLKFGLVYKVFVLLSYPEGPRPQRTTFSGKRQQHPIIRMYDTDPENYSTYQYLMTPCRMLDYTTDLRTMAINLRRRTESLILIAEYPHS